MKIVIFGKNGRLGSALAARLVKDGHEVNALDRPGCDVRNPRFLFHLITQNQPEVVINATAKNGLEQCAERPDEAIEVNTLAVSVMARAAHAVGALFVHYSTDYVFSGDEFGLYENTPTNPCGFYGHTKLWGEQAIREVGVTHFIFRLSSLYGVDLAGMLGPIRQVREGKGTPDDPVKVLDQWVAPTSTFFVAHQTSAILRLYEKAGGAVSTGLYHMATSEPVTKVDFTKHLLREVFGREFAVEVGYLWVPRPKFSHLVMNNLFANFPSLRRVDWKHDLQPVLPFLSPGNVK